MRRRMQIIFQDPYGSLDPRMTVSAIIAEPIETHNLADGRCEAERIAELLRLVGLDPTYVNRYPHEFSGGQRQRIGVARALAVEPEFIVCDEPISALDVSIQAQVLNLLTDLQRAARADLPVRRPRPVGRQAHQRPGRRSCTSARSSRSGRPTMLYAAPGHPYTRALLSAVPVPDPVAERKRRRVILKGDVPSPVNPPPGCRFHTRCWLYERLGQPENCRTTTRRSSRVAGSRTIGRPATAPTRRSRPTSASPTSTTTLVRRGTPPAALASLAALAGPAAADDAAAAAASDELEAPPPSRTCRRTPPPSRPATALGRRIRPDQNTPSKRADRWRRGRFGR